ncbi:hypothetical protein [Dyadobacter frigoris]|uniref:Uncharacterized protein n=1 Tax=Dyadobacter frigoris TaxID=2576211 RepID=A0A4U6CUZ8_9BACT|nr:hypothetical protein [Dyadobacter frigoris]TKT88550.1 hypothetical protein FDK13_26735 [Dyadobacter frigoris]GLU54597.1 hypothetical protein Dfri01_40580 [Dyadobacter frigoris]
MKFKILLFFIAAIALASCVDIPNFDDTPKIFYNSIDTETQLDSSGKKVQENITISINFEDGDGDLGASDAEIADSVKYRDWGNYELVTSTLTDGKWVDQILVVDKYKWFPDLKPDGKSGPIKGKLDLHTSAKYFNSSVPITIKYKVRIRDRALHVSNQEPTDSITVPGFR